MKSISYLPGHYVKLDSVDLSKDFGLLLKMQITFLISLIPSSWFFFRIAFALRPEVTEFFSITTYNGFSITLSGLMLLSLALALGILIVVHEAIHGLFFYLFTRRSPRFGFRFLYAYTASPEGVFIPRGQYLWIGLSPLVILTLIGLLLIPILPLAAIPTLVFTLILNASGSVGDLLMMGWLLRQPPGALLQDTGLAVTSFGPANKAEERR